MPSPVYQYMINMIVSLPIQRGLGVFMIVSVLEHHTLRKQIFWYHKVDCSDTSCKLSFWIISL